MPVAISSVASMPAAATAIFGGTMPAMTRRIKRMGMTMAGQKPSTKAWMMIQRKYSSMVKCHHGVTTGRALMKAPKAVPARAMAKILTRGCMGSGEVLEALHADRTRGPRSATARGCLGL